jgi:cell division protein FtsN
VTLSAFAAAVWLAYEQGVRRGLQLSPPIIRAESGPMKIPPVAAGGLDVPNQDKEVFDVLVAEEPEARVEQLLPPPDEPLPAPEPEPVVEPPAAELAAAPPIEPEPVVESEPEPVVEPEPEPAVAPTPPVEPAIVLTPPPGVAPRPAPEPAIVLTPPPGVEPRAVPEPVEVAALGEPTADILASFRLQLGSFRNRDSAMTHWATVLSSNRAVLEGLSPLVRTADFGDRGTFYRLQVGPLVSSIVAIALCDVLKTNNVDCLVLSP